MKKLILNISLVLGCLATVSPAFALSPPQDECQVDADCALQARCVQTQQTCVEWPEPGSEVCFTQKICEADPVTASCGTDADCAPDQHCKDPVELCTPCAFIDEDGDGENDFTCPPCELGQGTCEARPDEPSCASDADCGVGERCEHISACASCPFIDEDGDGQSDYQCPPCTDMSYCAEQTQPAQCQADADCDAGQECIIDALDCPACPFIDEDGDGRSDIICSPCPPPVGSCQAHEPNPSECSQDSDCGAHQRCELSTFLPECPLDGDGEGSDGDTAHCGYVTEGYCVADPQPHTCDSDADCGRDMVCISDVSCPPCVFVDGDGDGQNDAVCDAGCEVTSHCEPREPEHGTSCSTDADCASDLECILEDQDLACPAVCEPADLDGDGSYDECASNCAPIGVCQPRQECGTELEPVPMPHEEEDSSLGELLGCQSTQQKSAPTTLSLLALGLFGLITARRRRRKA